MTGWAIEGKVTTSTVGAAIDTGTSLVSCLAQFSKGAPLTTSFQIYVPTAMAAKIVRISSHPSRELANTFSASKVLQDPWCQDLQARQRQRSHHLELPLLLQAQHRSHFWRKHEAIQDGPTRPQPRLRYGIQDAMRGWNPRLGLGGHGRQAHFDRGGCVPQVVVLVSPCRDVRLL